MASAAIARLSAPERGAINTPAAKPHTAPAILPMKKPATLFALMESPSIESTYIS
jgi:hypothetical protein